MTPGECRAARALLGWSQDELVRHSGVAKKTIADFERGATKRPHAVSISAIIAAFEAAGIEFIPRGVRMRSRRKLNQQEVEPDTG